VLWDLQKKAFEGIIPEPEDFDDKDSEAENKIKNLSGEVGTLLEQNHLDRALKKIMEFSSFFNQYFQHQEPWKKGPGTSSCVYLSVNAARSMSIALFPFVPQAAQKIWAQLGLEGKVNANKWDSLSNLEIRPGRNLGEVSPLFSKVESEDIEKYKKQLGHLNHND